MFSWLVLAASLNTVINTRSLPMYEPVKVQPVAPDAAQDAFAHTLARHMPDLDARMRAWAVLGLSTDPAELAALTQAPSDWFDVTSGQVMTQGRVEPSARSLELALQHQNFDLGRLLERDYRNADVARSLLSIAYGDAAVIERSITPQRMQPLPTSALSQEWQFSALYGERFIRITANYGSWNGVNLLFSERQPLSSEQILHPDKFFRKPDWPTQVRLPDLGDALGGTTLHEDTFGEWGTLRILSATLPPDVAMEAAAGWDGDRWRLVEHPSSDGLAWFSVWDSEADAEEFETAIREVVRKLVRNIPKKADRVTHRDGRQVLVSRRGDEVVVLFGLHDAKLDASSEAIFLGAQMETLSELRATGPLRLQES